MGESIALSQKLEQKFGLLVSLHSLGDLELDAGEFARAEDGYREALRLAQTLEAPRLVCYCVAGLSATAAERGHTKRALRLWGSALALERELRFSLRRREVYERRLQTLAEPAQELDESPVDLAEVVAYALESSD